MFTAWNAVSTLDRMFDDVMGSSLGAATNAQAFSPQIDVRSSETEVRFICDVPGIKREDLDITLDNRVLTIKGARKFENQENQQVMLGRSYGHFKRQFALPASLDESKLSAQLEDGVLTVSIPKHPKAQPIKIQIGTAAKQLGE